MECPRKKLFGDPMRELIIVCEDSFGLDVRMIAEAMNEWFEQNYGSIRYRLLGYVVPAGTSIKQNPDSLPVLGTIEEWHPGTEERYAMGIVDPLRKELAVMALKNKGAVFETLWAPWVLAPLTMKFGEGSIIAAHSIKVSTEIGPFVTLYKSMTDGARVEAYTSVMGFSNTTTAILEKGVYIGSNAVVLDGVVVGAGAYVEPNSVVVKNVKPGARVSGIPAKKVKWKES